MIKELSSSKIFQVEPFARDAKYFSETKLLHKNVRVVPQDVDKYNNLYGFIFYDAGDQVRKVIVFFLLSYF